MSEALFGIHGAALEVRSKRMNVLASNIANAATPGYKARDVDFAAALDAKLAQGRAAKSGAADLGASAEAPLLYRTPTMPELNREQLAFAENALAYSATLSFVQGKVNTLTRALKGE